MATTSLEAKPVALSTAFAVLHDARRELRLAADNSIELAEKLAAGAIRFARKVVGHLDDAAGEVLARAEHAIATGVQDGRERAQAAAA
ncbi:MAG: hypothetical protein SFX73_25925 [Kofleriaceae bacterium]|nr:hypothetical protein [Kofleriaceae bacterium]